MVGSKSVALCFGFLRRTGASTQKKSSRICNQLVFNFEPRRGVHGKGQEGQPPPPPFFCWLLSLALFRLLNINRCCVISVYFFRFPPF